MATSSLSVEALLNQFDTSSSNAKDGVWLQALVQFLHGAVKHDAESLMHLNLAVRKRYGSPLLKASFSSLLQSLFEQWCSADSNDDDLDEGVDANAGAPTNADAMDDGRRGLSSSGIKQGLQKSLATLSSLGWFKMHRADFIHVLQTAIKAHVKEVCKDNFETLLLQELQSWVRETVLPFAEAAVGQSSSQSLEPLLTQSLLKSLAQVRASELFNIVADFPDSMCAVKEMKAAIAQPATLGLVGKEFRAAVCKRLLHVGASTTQIVGFYVSMIRALRVMDSSDLLLNYVAAPVRSYLVGRKDTVRCVVSALTEGKGSELHGELKRGGSLEYAADEDDEDGVAIGPTGEQWEPRKRNLDLAEAGGRGLDVLALLVSIYGSTDLFVSDYRSMLADKLLANLDYRADSELATLELLTIRFGEEALHCCEVMLRDLEESRRINGMLQSTMSNSGKTTTLTDCLIVSDNYWPALQKDDMVLHPTALAAVSAFEAAYAAAKKPRKLELVPQLGLVNLELEFDDGSARTFLATPVQASLILHLSDNSPESLTSLAAKCELDESEVRRRMAFWVSREVCRESEVPGEVTFYAVIEEQHNRAAVEASAEPQEEAQQQMTLGTDVMEKAALAQYETYVKSLLTNHGSMTLERIHTMLKLMASGGATGGSPKFEMNLVELQRFLQSLGDQDKVENVEGKWILRGKN